MSEEEAEENGLDEEHLAFQSKETNTGPKIEWRARIQIRSKRESELLLIKHIFSCPFLARSVFISMMSGEREREREHK